MSKEFGLKDLHSGYIVRLRNNRLLMVTRVATFTKIFVDRYGYWSYASNWNEKFNSSQHNYYAGNMPCMYFEPNDVKSDIIEVYGLISKPDNYCGALSYDLTSRPLIWKRPQAVRMTLAEVEEKLGYPVEIVADKGDAR